VENLYSLAVFIEWSTSGAAIFQVGRQSCGAAFPAKEYVKMLFSAQLFDIT
jgi:hypothetical protein